MALDICDECGKEVSSKAEACPHCGAPIKKFSWFAFIILGIIIFAGVSTFIPSENKSSAIKNAPSAKTKNELKQKSLEAEEKREKERIKETCNSIDYSTIENTLIHRIEPDGRRVYVTRSWYLLKLEEKQGIAAFMANCKSQGEFSVILDSHSGKKLAMYGKSFGYSNYED